MIMKSFFTIIFIACFVYKGQSQSSLQDQKSWNSDWIAPANVDGEDYGVYYFRKNINLSSRPDSFLIHVSADNRYKLFVNGELVSLGPARGDTFFWNYETINLSKYLKEGENSIAAIVWNEAEYRPEAQITVRTGFILQGDSKPEEILNSNTTWKCIQDKSFHPIPGYFFAASKGQLVDMNDAIEANWKTSDFDDSSWPAANKILSGKLKGNSDGLAWQLVPSTLPQMEMTMQRIPTLRSAKGIQVPPTFPKERTPLIIPSNTKVTLLLDQNFETNAYVTVAFSGGKGAGISLGYAETLYEKGGNGREKGNRNDIDGKEFIGRKDSIIVEGSKNQSFTSLNYRTYRYIKIEVETKEEALTLDDIYGTFTGYPFEKVSKFDNKNEEIEKIIEIGWRTARLNAWETYMDCPYYEQLQYIGDTRIQALVSYYNSTDGRLAKNALNLMDHSRLPEGVTMSRYPTHSTQIISTFSLWYVCMLHDYWMYKDDSKFVKNKLVGARAILDFFGKYQQEDGSIKDMPYWGFVDWAGDMGWGPQAPDGNAAIYDLQLLMAYQRAADMEKEIGLKVYADAYQKKASQLKETINDKYWDSTRNLYADTSEKSGFSQHVNSLAILTGIAKKENIAKIADGLMTDKSLNQCSIYFKYYLHRALVKAGKGDDYMSWLGIWRDNIKMGLTTWAEDSSLNTVRSDCHAWGSSPNIEFFRTVLGIDSNAPGFKKVKVEPHLGSITNVSGEVPHPAGVIKVSYQFVDGKWNIKIDLPEETSGKFVWNNQEFALNEGMNKFIF